MHFHVVGATLAQIQIVFVGADRVGVALNRERCLRVAFQKIDKLLENVARLQIGAIETEELILRHPNFRSRTERTFLRKQLVEIAKAGRAFFVWTGAIAWKFARECVRTFVDRARARFLSPNRGWG